MLGGKGRAPSRHAGNRLSYTTVEYISIVFVVVEIAIGISALLVAIFTLKLQFFSRPKEELEHLQIQFKATQRLSLQVQKELEQFIFEYHVGENEIFSGVRYKDYLAEMKKSFRENLSDEIFNRAISFKLSKSNIYSMTKSLETQFEALSQIHINLTLLLNNVTSRTTSGSARIFSDEGNSVP